MANNLSVKIGANTADLEKSIDRAKKTLEQYSRTAKRAKSEIENNVSVSNQQVNAYQRVVNQLEKVNSGTLATTQQQKVLTNQVRELKIQWNALTGDQKISGFGQSVANSLKAAESELETTKQKLASVSEQTKKTAESSESYSSSNIKLTSVLGKLGGAIGIAQGAMYAFNEILKTSQSLGDAWEATMAGMDNATRSFWNSLASLDFTGMIEGINGAYVAGQKYAQVLDTLATYTGNAGVLNEQWNATLSETEAVLRDSNATTEQKKQAVERANKATQEYKETLSAEYQLTIRSLNANLRMYDTFRKNASGANLSGQELTQLAQVYATNSSIIENKLIPAWDAANNTFTGGARQREEVINAFGRQLGITQDQVLALITMYSKMDDEAKKSFNNQTISAIQYQTALAGADKRLNRAEGRTNQGTRTPSFHAPKVSKPVEKNMLQEMEEQNKKYQQQYEFITKNFDKLVEQTKIQKTITDNLKKQKELLEISATLDTSKIDTSQLKPVSLQDIIPKTDIPLEIKPVLNKKEMDKITKEAGDAEKKRLKEQADAEKKYADDVNKSVSTIGSSFSTLGNVIGGTTGQIISSMGQMISMVPGILQAIDAITAAKEGEAVASGTAEGAKAPWFMQVAVIAGLVANIVATFASIGKYANGGIIQGGSRIGDYNIARVNDGEMILNGSQQSNLFKILNSPIADQQQSTSIASTKVRGQDIYISLKTFLKENPSKKL